MASDDFGEFRRLRDAQVPRLSGATLRLVAGLVLVLILLFTSFYTIAPEEVGVVTRFGRYVRTTDPGLHFKIPFMIERVQKVPVQRQLKEEFGFRTMQPGVRSEFSTRGLEGESNMLTGDLNAAIVEWVVQYRIVDPYRFLFRVRGVQDTFRAMSEAVMRQIVGDRTVNEILTVGRAEIAMEVLLALQVLADQYETGIKVDQVVLQDVNPPDPVKPSFNEVNQAQQERERLINQAQSEYNRIIPRARGEAEQVIAAAEGYALERVNHARGDSSRFTSLFQEYRLAPDVTRRRIYLETMNRVLPQAQRKVIVDDDLRSILPLLNLDTGSGPRTGGESK